MKNKTTLILLILLFSIFLLPSFIEKIRTKKLTFNQQKTGIIAVKSEFVKPLLGSNKIIYESQQKNHAGIIQYLGSIVPTSLRKKNNEPINFMILGISGPGYIAPNLTDSILVLNIDFKTNNSTLISIPRDLYVKIPNTQNYTKINALYTLNENKPELIQKKLEEITGLKINYYVIINLKAVEDITNAIGGININVPENVYDPLFPGANNKYEPFSISKGWQTLNGATVLKYIRTRHSKYGDFDRMKRQQQIIEALKNKLNSLSLIWDIKKYYAIFETVNKNIQTNLDTFQIIEFLNSAKKLSFGNTKKIIIDAIGENSLIKEQIIKINNNSMFALVPKRGLENYEDIKNFIKNELE